MVAEGAANAADPWWIIGSAAVALHGGPVPRIKDVDLVMSAADAERFLRRAGVEPRRGTGDGRFRSLVFGTWSSSGGRAAPPIAVEAFGGFELRAAGAWREVTLETREEMRVGAARVFVPSREELVSLLRSFGRAKDLDRARLLGS